MSLPITQVDAFTDRPFAGNPAAVCILSGPRKAEWMQKVAREMNLSETAFLMPTDEGYMLRWFTPAGEVDLCGHATLASAHVLWEQGHLEPDAEAVFLTASGRITARPTQDGIEMDFPLEAAEACQAVPGLVAGLGVRPRFVGRNRLDYLVELESEQLVRDLQPDFTALRRLESRGVMITAACESPPYDFVSRYFCPAFGIDEDPVTGSAHCALGPYWKQRLAKDPLVGYQASARGGVVTVSVTDDDRVLLRGQAVTVLRAELLDVCVADS